MYIFFIIRIIMTTITVHRLSADACAQKKKAAQNQTGRAIAHVARHTRDIYFKVKKESEIT